MDNNSSVSLTRLDKNVAEYILDFKGFYKQDESLIKKLVFFFAHDFQHRICTETIFGNKILDPAVFAKVIGLKDYRSLLNIHPNPAQFRGKTEEEVKEMKVEAKKSGEPLWNSWLDNALYRARYESLRFSSSGKTPDGFGTSELKEIKFLKYVKKFQNKSTKKIYYELDYDETFINDLARYFLKFDFNIFVALEKPSYQDFYISLIHLRDKVNHENLHFVRVSTQFDYLCKIAKTNCASPEDRKKHINMAIKEMNSKIGSQFVKIRWENNGNHNFKPVLEFSLTDKEIAEQKRESSARLEQFTLNNLKSKFKDLFPTQTDEQEYKKQFLRFLRDTDWLFEVKQSVLIQTYIQVYGKEVKDPWSAQVVNYLKDTLPLMAEKAFS